MADKKPEKPFPITDDLFDKVAASPRSTRDELEKLASLVPAEWINEAREVLDKRASRIQDCGPKKIVVSYTPIGTRQNIKATLTLTKAGWGVIGNADGFDMTVACLTFVRAHDFVQTACAAPKTLSPFLAEADAAYAGKAPQQIMKWLTQFEKAWEKRVATHEFNRAMEKILSEMCPYYWVISSTILQKVDITKTTDPFAYLGNLAAAVEINRLSLHEWVARAIRTLPSAPHYDLARREIRLREWRQRLLDEAGVVTPDTAANPTSLRLLRQTPTRYRWQIQEHPGEWRDLTDAEKRGFEHDREHALHLDTEDYGVISAFLGLGRGGLMPLRFDLEKNKAHAELLGKILSMNALRRRVVDERGEPVGWAERRLAWDFRQHPARADELVPLLTWEDGTDLLAEVRHLHGAVYQVGDEFSRGPHPISGYSGRGTEPEGIPAGVFDDPEVLVALKPRRMRVPANKSGARLLPIIPAVKLTLAPATPHVPERVRVDLLGLDDRGRVRVEREKRRWCIRAVVDDEPEVIPDLAELSAALAHFQNNINLPDEPPGMAPGATRDQIAEIAAWLRGFAPGVRIDADPTLAALLRPADRAAYDFDIAASENSRDWFDLKLVLKPEDTDLTKEDLQLLLAGKGDWVRLPRKGWRRLETDLDVDTRKRLDDLGVNADAPHGDTHRFHAAQLASVKFSERADAEVLARIRERAEAVRRIEPPALPAGLRAELRPYQKDGYHFLAHLSANGLGGVLADDMGLGKTVQTIAWLLWLKGVGPALSRDRDDSRSPRGDDSQSDAALSAPSGTSLVEFDSDAVAASRKRGPYENNFRALIVAPKSVTTNWVAEFEKFAPGLRVAMWGTEAVATAEVVVMNYARLRSESETLAGESWTAVVLDEGHYIKNPTAQVAEAARALRTTHRLVLSGTPVENRLLDLWSLYAFAMPGVLGTQASFKRQYDERKDPKAAARLAGRVRPFLLRRTKAQVATDLPERSEEDLVVELEPKQRKLYDAEIKKARALLLKVNSARDFDQSRFNILTSLLRLRQICCDPRLVSPDAKESDSAKLDALWELVEPLVQEGHKVLVFSQFTEALELVGRKLDAESVGFLKITGATENRSELVERFQKPDTEKVFLLSLKAAGTGLNLTAASYVVLFDPWWNPAAEAQAIDRTHRIGQKNRVIAYRLIAKNTVEEKIRALQRDKAALACEILQEESLSKVLDIDTLRGILAE